nr:nucleotidyltransferase family protein [Methanobacterium formicicum]
MIKKDFNKVKRILLHENYEAVMNLNESKESEYIKFQREYKFRNITNNILLEIQWNPIGFSFSLSNFRYFPANNFKSISLNELDVETFTDEDLILILSIHVAGHMWSRLSWLFDLAELIKRSETINWNQLMEKSHYLSIKRILSLNLSLSKKII